MKITKMKKEKKNKIIKSKTTPKATAVYVHRQNPSHCGCARTVCDVCSNHFFALHHKSLEGDAPKGETVWAKLRFRRHCAEREKLLREWIPTE